MQLSSSRIQLCSIWEATLHQIYNTGVHRCTVCTIGVQLCITSVSLKSIFVISGADCAQFGAWLCSISGVRDAVVGLCRQGVQLSNISSPKAGICQSWRWSLVGFLTFFGGIYNLWNGFFWGGRARGSGW